MRKMLKWRPFSMRLHEATVGEFKNLHNFHIDFDHESPYTVLVGENGAGKSNLIEALTIIFRNLDLNSKAAFDFEIEYQCRDWDIKVQAQKDQAPQFWKRDVGTEDYADLPGRRFM